MTQSKIPLIVPIHRGQKNDHRIQYILLFPIIGHCFLVTLLKKLIQNINSFENYIKKQILYIKMHFSTFEPYFPTIKYSDFHEILHGVSVTF